jgi:hypothetical protein
VTRWCKEATNTDVDMKQSMAVLPSRTSLALILLAVLISLAFAQCEARGQEVGATQPSVGVQWQVTELAFTASARYADPFDYRTSRFHAEFRGPAGETVRIPGFWAGGDSWKVRFTPTVTGRWTYATTCSNTADLGLHGKHGALDVAVAEGHGLAEHGGFLKVSPNGRYLTYTDGTPFFWLADTWWTCPSAKVSIETFHRLVDTRVAQNYTVFQAHGFRSLGTGGGVNAFQAVQSASADVAAYWNAVDRYYAYAARSGLLGIIGFYGGWSLNTYTYENHERLWHYVLARYGAYPITFLITQEYNVMTPSTKGKDLDERFVELGAFIKAHDPYDRAMSVHPWAHGRDNRRAWSEPWHDFTLLQAGHFTRVRPSYYWDIYFKTAAKPFVQSEQNYEGFLRDSFSADASCIRASAYSAIQTGSFGFSYGAQGLYGGVVSKDQPGPTSRWGAVLTWDEGLILPGGRQLQHLRSFYESVDWWRLEPLPGACLGDHRILVKSDRAQTFALWFPEAADRPSELQLLATRCKGAVYSGRWTNPRTGENTATEPVSVPGERLSLPVPPDAQDWLLVLQHKAGGTILPMVTTAEWHFGKGLQGWDVELGISDLKLRDGCLVGTITGPDPILLSPAGLNVNVTHTPVVEIRLRNGTPLTEGRVYFRTSADDTFRGNSVSFDMAPSERGMVTYRVDMTGHRHWCGWLQQLRIDPGDFRKTDIVPTGRFAVESVRLVSARSERGD